MNYKQRKILRKLIEQNGQKYSELYRHFEYEDKFPYHIKQLVKKGFVNKRDGKYYITKFGIQAKPYFDSLDLRERKLKITRIWLICPYENKFLLQTAFEKGRSRGPCYFLPGGNTTVGESLTAACSRILMKKFGLQGSFSYRATHHHINYTTDGDILFDDIGLVFDVDLSKKPRSNVGWFTPSEIQKLKNLSPLIKRYLIDDDWRPFSKSTTVFNYGFEEEDLI